MLIEEVECRARAREKEKAALMRDAKLEVAYNIISEVYREAAAESYPNWTKQKQNDMDEVADCTHVILKQIIYLSHKLEDLNTRTLPETSCTSGTTAGPEPRQTFRGWRRRTSA